MRLQSKRKNIFNSRKYKIERPIRYKNPFKIKQWLLQFKLFRVINIILLVCIIIGLYFVFFSNFYIINNIEITGNEIASTDDLLAAINGYLQQNSLIILKNKNIFIFNKPKVAALINQIVILDTLKIEKILPNTIKISLKEKKAVFKIQINEQDYLLDDQGEIIKRYYKLVTPGIFQLSTEEKPTNSNNYQTDKLIFIKDLGNQTVNLGDHVIANNDLAFIQKLITKIQSYNYLTISELQIPNNYPQYLIVKLDNNCLIYFNLADDLDLQLKRLDLIIMQKIKIENLSGIDYIDLRLGESIYYKNR